MNQADENNFDVVVIGGGQAGLSLGFYLRRANLSYVVLDAQSEPGGAWQHAWKSLRLFSPAQWSSLPGWLMPGGGADKYPTRDEVLAYLRQYEERYKLPVKRPVSVSAVKPAPEHLIVETTKGKLLARAVISATGSWQKPFVPDYPGRASFTGVQIHSARYESPEPFAGKRVLVIGGGNSGAQILAEVSLISDATWVTLEAPQFLPDDVDGRVLFDAASERYRALTAAAGAQSDSSQIASSKSRDLLGSIVVVEPVKKARDDNRLESRRPFERFTETGVIWSGGDEEKIDAVIWATGFQPALDHLRPLGIVTENNRVETIGTHSIKEPRLWLVGYGNWTGFASATIIGVGRTARKTVEEISTMLSSNHL